MGRTILILMFFCVGACWGQVTVSQFNSNWNNKNGIDISVLNDCEIQNAVICENPKLKEKHNITSVPTIIIFEEGKEIKRFEANIMFELSCTIKEIQSEVDKILLSKFE